MCLNSLVFRAYTVISTFTAHVDHSQVHFSYEHISWVHHNKYEFFTHQHEYYIANSAFDPAVRMAYSHCLYS